MGSIVVSKSCFRVHLTQTFVALDAQAAAADRAYVLDEFDDRMQFDDVLLLLVALVLDDLVARRFGLLENCLISMPASASSRMKLGHLGRLEDLVERDALLQS